MSSCLSVTVTMVVGSLDPQPSLLVGLRSPGIRLFRDRAAAEERSARIEDFLVKGTLNILLGKGALWGI